MFKVQSIAKEQMAIIQTVTASHNLESIEFKFKKERRIEGSSRL